MMSEESKSIPRYATSPVATTASPSSVVTRVALLASEETTHTVEKITERSGTTWQKSAGVNDLHGISQNSIVLQILAGVRSVAVKVG